MVIIIITTTTTTTTNNNNNNNKNLLCMYLDIITDIKKKSLEWIGHVVRMYQGRKFKKIFESKSDGSR